ncbi:hypothetical protein BDS110ZK4_40770 [Bradyrhizobium diazoefficiens]|uniref:Uncharacterized protein n=1 Tax=Bradyrhizobium diazoefficiens TaxID=1355477 RepID=A0A809ZK54_9BRAD|nr:hypothetical protein XF1B_80050 [Bradyrhizobium diazoefficiens]BCE51583.1 hypothetical protein XF4B_79320 [Bradyrhizobium diazoefficiens]BCE95079.1 hypothetical protein XF10B_78770 [Bradyrhizobium diazoefficiens]BCF30025.1 hypothetical protein XF14B_79770 [Bradyrhizobium diazoefficiens]
MELREFLRWIDANGVERASEFIDLLRYRANDLEREGSIGLFDDESNKQAHRLGERQLVSRIERLMLESNLKKTEAVKVVTQLLTERGYPPSSIPDSNKIGFHTWIAKLLRNIKPEDLLNVASTVRNYAVHGLDWPLRREKP